MGQAAVDAAWKDLDNQDRFVQFAARVALEHQDATLWASKALAETGPLKATLALLALTRVSAPDPFHRKPTDPEADPALRAKIVAALSRIDHTKLPDDQKLDLIRVYHVLFNRFGRPTPAESAAVIAKFDPVFPDKNRFVNG